MEIVMLVVTVLSLGLAFRLRGGLFGKEIGWGSTTARLVAWSLPVTLFVAYWYPPILFTAFINYISFDYLYIPLVFIGAYLGSVLGWWGTIDMGRIEGEWIKEFTLHSARGILWTAGVAGVFTLYGLFIPAIALLISGISCGIIYEIGWRTPTFFKPTPEGGFNTGSEIGEFLFGAVIGLAIALGSII